jgi:cyanate permease
MLLGRFLVGIGIGVNTVLVPIYISEVHFCYSANNLCFYVLSLTYGAMLSNHIIKFSNAYLCPLLAAF